MGGTASEYARVTTDKEGRTSQATKRHLFWFLQLTVVDEPFSTPDNMRDKRLEKAAGKCGKNKLPEMTLPANRPIYE